MNDLQFYKLALAFIPNVGAKMSKVLVSYCGGVEAVFKTRKSALLKIPGIGPKSAENIIKQSYFTKVEKEQSILAKANIQTTFYLDDDYPRRLSNYEDCPILFYYKGKKFDKPRRTIGIVGTRSPSEYGKQMTDRIVQGLKKYNVTIISGLAYGIDSAAHKKSVELDMSTYAIMGNGFNRIYPAQNKKLSELMQLEGGLITEYSFDTIPDRENFPRRNRIIAGLSDAIIVVESARKGGSIITTEYANAYHKDVFAVPGKISDEKSEGCNKLIKQHKAALLESAEDIAYIMRWDEDNLEEEQMILPLDLSPKETLLIQTIKTNETMTIDQLHYTLKMPLSEVSSLLLNLEFQGIIRSLPGKKYNLA